MYISKFKVSNYKSFLETENIEVNKGINIITGQNNAGKTALLQILSLKYQSKPHRSTKTLPSRNSLPNNLSIIDIEFTLSRQEIVTFLYSQSGNIQLPMPMLYNMANANLLTTETFFTNYFDEDNVIRCKFCDTQLMESAFVFTKNVNNSYTHFFNFDINSKTISNQGGNSNQVQDFSKLIVSQFLTQFYSFKAERLNVSHSSHGSNAILNSDASNLPEVLNILQGDIVRFERYNSYVRRIFPQIHQITTRPFTRQENRIEIVVWNEDIKLERSDLVVPLAECGTGVGQVLALLYVLLTSDVPKVIIIDEPNSFLHPGASRKLIEILKEHPQHQYIISTHSPSTIAASNPQSINIVKSKNAQSTIETIDVNDTNDQQLYLAEIGSKLSDVFGADNILWVEGKTEEICLPKIIEEMDNVSLMGTVILSVINTGDFHKKNADLIFRTYTRLSTGKGLLPPALGFFFDSEDLTKTEKDDLIRKGNGKVHFTKRKMFENYLLNPDAIFSVINSIEEIHDLGITLEQIKDWIENNKWGKKFISQTYTKVKNNDDWVTNVDGAKFLEAMFTSISDNKLTFDKIQHSVAICEWIIENAFEDLAEIKDMLSAFLKVK
jgi:predicted ATPase